MFLADFFSTIGMDEQPIEYFFGIHHLVYLLINIILFVFIFKFLQKHNKKRQDYFINIALILIIFLKYLGEALFIYEYYNITPAYSSYPHPFWDINTFFSFQLCGVMNIVLPIVIWFDIKPLKTFVFSTSILGGLAVIFYPVTVLYGAPYQITLPIIRSSVIHFFLVLIPLFLIYRGDIVLDKRKWWQVAIGLGTVSAWAMIGNLFIDKTANNMYFMSNPFYQGPIPIINQLPNGYHVIFLTVAVTLGYIITFNIARYFTILKKSE